MHKLKSIKTKGEQKKKQILRFHDTCPVKSLHENELVGKAINIIIPEEEDQQLQHRRCSEV